MYGWVGGFGWMNWSMLLVVISFSTVLLLFVGDGGGFISRMFGDLERLSDDNDGRYRTPHGVKKERKKRSEEKCYQSVCS